MHSKAVQGHTLTINEIPSHTHTRGSMNISGSVYFPHTKEQTGVFTTKSNDWQIGFGQDKSQPIYWGYLLFNAASGWTGETSAVGGGASHTHGIKMMIIVNEKPSHTHTRGSMNITGGMYDFAIFVSSSGAFSGTRTGNVYKLNEGLDHVDNKFFDGFSFNAANTWTGEINFLLV